jgi:hypothetical protein
MPLGRPAARLGVWVALVLAVAGCRAGDEGGRRQPQPQPPVTTSAGAAATGCVKKEQGTGCLALAPEGRRVDRGTPGFSRPGEITNPLFPIAE